MRKEPEQMSWNGRSPRVPDRELDLAQSIVQTSVGNANHQRGIKNKLGLERHGRSKPSRWEVMKKCIVITAKVFCTIHKAAHHPPHNAALIPPRPTGTKHSNARRKAQRHPEKLETQT